MVRPEVPLLVTHALDRIIKAILVVRMVWWSSCEISWLL